MDKPGKQEHRHLYIEVHSNRPIMRSFTENHECIASEDPSKWQVAIRINGRTVFHIQHDEVCGTKVVSGD